MYHTGFLVSSCVQSESSPGKRSSRFELRSGCFPRVRDRLLHEQDLGSGDGTAQSVPPSALASIRSLRPPSCRGLGLLGASPMRCLTRALCSIPVAPCKQKATLSMGQGQRSVGCWRPDGLSRQAALSHLSRLSAALSRQGSETWGKP